MASEAKIGLLLGLVIIFIIAFVLNELPRFGDASKAEPPAGFEVEDATGIGMNVRPHVGANTPNEPIEEPGTNLPEPNNSEAVTTHASLPAIQPIPPEPSIDRTAGTSGSNTVRRAVSKVYHVVAEGESLADIAKKFYGPVEGNRIVNVLRIFQANRELLKSADKIRVGQKLVIPRLASSETDEVAIGGIFPSSMFERVESIGRRHSQAENRTPGQNRQYVVREGDSLWRVAETELGDPSRYKEISKLNAGILEDEDTIIVGMRLKLPIR